MLKWTKNEVVYQLYPQSFYDTNGDGIGDIEGITTKLDYLKSLGVGAIWICPMYDSPNRDNGYDVRNYDKLQICYGTDEQFDEMVAEAHKRNIKIIMDLVLNHTSNENPWFLQSSSSRTNDKADWYIWRDGKPDGTPPTNWGAIFGGSAWTYCQQRNQYYLHTFSPYQPDLNWQCDELKNALFAMVNRWIDRGVDGFRLDAINFIAKDLSPIVDGEINVGEYADIYPFVANKPDAHKYLAELKAATFARGCLTVGEASSATVSDALLFANELDMIFQFEHVAMDIAEDWNVKPVDIVKLKKSFAKWQNGLFGRAWNALFWENHDQPRIVTRMGDENELRESSAKMLATCMYFMQGTPFIYQGQELGMINTRFYSKNEIRDIEVRNAWTKYVDGGLLSEKEFLKRISRRSRDTARTPMCWSDGKNAGFTDGTPWIKINDKYKQINVAEQSSRSDSVLNYYKALFALRAKLSVVVDGAFKLIDEQNAHVIAYERKNVEQTIAVVCNMTAQRLSFIDERLQRGKILLTNIENNYLADGILAPYQSIVIDLES